MWEKKGRTLLIVLAVAMSSAIFFSTQSLSGNLEKMYMNVVRKDFGSADIVVEGGNTAESSVFSSHSGGGIRRDCRVLCGKWLYDHRQGTSPHKTPRIQPGF